MKIRRLWLVLLLALGAMQAHALLHVNHDATATDPSCLSCKLHADLSGAAAPAGTLLPSAAAYAPALPASAPPRRECTAHLRPPLRGPPRISKA